MKKIVIINGPNLNLIGTRQPEIYGNVSIDMYINELRAEFSEIEIDYFQSNIEGELINKLHENNDSEIGVIINAGAYSHTSIAIADAILSINSKVVEVHISNIFAREPYRRHSYISAVAKGVICGFGLESYRLALLALMAKS